LAFITNQSPFKYHNRIRAPDYPESPPAKLQRIPPAALKSFFLYQRSFPDELHLLLAKQAQLLLQEKPHIIQGLFLKPGS
jgi:hypothetical protein